jgi:hypothetical protein
MKKLLLMTAALGIFSGVYAKKVKVQVDMAGQTVSGDGVHVAGNFQGWSPSSTSLTNSGGTIYSAVVDMPANTVAELKFINGNDWPQAETVPALNRVGYLATNGGVNENRWFYIDSTSNDTTVLPAVLFGGEAPSGKFAVRISVDMQKEASVSANGVHIAGSLQGWDPATTGMANLFNSNMVYEWIGYLDAASYEYKFVNGNAWGSDESIPSSCAVNNNRGVTVSANTALDKVCYTSCVACPVTPLPRYKASFIVDMSNSDCNGGFDSVTVTGSRPEITSWGAGITLTKMGTTMFYVAEIEMDSGELQFKFRNHKNNNTNWEGGDNRVWVLSADDTLDLTCFGSRIVGACPAKPAPSDVTFMVDLTNETPDGQGKIYVIGEFTVPNWQSGAIRLAPVAGHPGFYSTTVNICQGSFSYKFMNGDSSITGTEESFPDSTKRACLVPSGVGNYNRTYTRTSANPVLLSFVYNECTVADTTSSVGLRDIAGLLNNVRVYPNPSSAIATVEFNDHATLHNIAVTDIAGRLVASYENLPDNRFVLNKSETGTGMLFVTITNNRGESKTVKLIIQ